MVTQANFRRPSMAQKKAARDLGRKRKGKSPKQWGGIRLGKKEEKSQESNKSGASGFEEVRDTYRALQTMRKTMQSGVSSLQEIGDAYNAFNTIRSKFSKGDSTAMTQRRINWAEFRRKPSQAHRRAMRDLGRKRQGKSRDQWEGLELGGGKKERGGGDKGKGKKKDNTLRNAAIGAGVVGVTALGIQGAMKSIKAKEAADAAVGARGRGWSQEIETPGARGRGWSQETEIPGAKGQGWSQKIKTPGVGDSPGALVRSPKGGMVDSYIPISPTDIPSSGLAGREQKRLPGQRGLPPGVSQRQLSGQKALPGGADEAGQRQSQRSNSKAYTPYTKKKKKRYGFGFKFSPILAKFSSPPTIRLSPSRLKAVRRGYL